MILTEHAAQITPGEEYRSTPMEALYTWLLSTMRRNYIDFRSHSPDQTHARRLIPVHSAFPWAQVAFAEMCV